MRMRLHLGTKNLERTVESLKTRYVNICRFSLIKLSSMFQEKRLSSRCWKLMESNYLDKGYITIQHMRI